MLPLIIAFIFSSTVEAKHCREMQKVGEFLNTNKFINASREARKDKHEAHLDLEDVNQAKMLAYRFPAFEDLGFGRPGGPDWHFYESRHPHSVLNGKKVGWEVKNGNGHARVRLDWDPEKGGHYNIEITEKKANRHETHKLAISFLCGGKKCTEHQIEKMAEKMQ